MRSSNARVNPCIILKITSPRKTPDTTTVFDGGPWNPESWSNMGELPEPPPISKPKEPMARCTHEAIWESWPLTPSPTPRSRPTVRAFKCSTLSPLCRALGFSVQNVYRLPNALAEHQCDFGVLWEAVLDVTLSYITTYCTYLHLSACAPEIMLVFVSKILRQYSSSWTIWGFYLKSPLCRESGFVLTLASLLQLFSLWPQ